MELARLITGLSDPAAYPHSIGAEAVEVRQTHISAVFLAGPYAYKVKKPLDLGFLDFSTLERRRHFCEEEVRLNRRLAPSVYLGVVPVAPHGTAGPDGGRRRGRRVGREDGAAARRGHAPRAAPPRRGRRRAGGGAWPAGSPRSTPGPRAARAIAAFGRFEVVAGNARENFDQSAAQVGTTLSRAVFERLRGLTEAALAASGR